MSEVKFEINGIERKYDTLVILGAYRPKEQEGIVFEDLQYNPEKEDIWALPQLLTQFIKKDGDINLFAEDMPEYTYIFEIHTMETRPEHLIGLYQNEWEDKPKIMQEQYSFGEDPRYSNPRTISIPNSHAYPLKSIILQYNSNYFLCSFNYMVALAMYMGYKKIIFRGVNMLMTDDLIQKWSLEYWLGRAQQAGIELDFSENCDLLKCGKLYGYEAVNTLGVYMHKYISTLQTSLRNDLVRIYRHVVTAIDEFDTIHENRQKFMKEILNRHDLGYTVDDEIEKNLED